MPYNCLLLNINLGVANDFWQTFFRSIHDMIRMNLRPVCGLGWCGDFSSHKPPEMGGRCWCEKIGTIRNRDRVDRLAPLVYD
jgi:hypothetical protein